MAEEASTEEIETGADGAAEKREPKRSKSEEFMLREDVIEFTTLSKSVIRRMMLRDEFPKPVKLSPNRVAWVKSEVEAWKEAKKLEREAERQAA